jgi:hypothetical protein
MRLTFQHTLGDILELNRSGREQRLMAWLVTLLGVGSLFVGIWVAIFQDNRPEPTPVFIAAGVFILLGCFATRLAGLGAWFLKAERTPFEIDVGPEGVVFLERGERAVVGWESFSRWYETETLLVLVAHGDAVAIPKRSSSEAGWRELLALVRTNLGSPARC